MSSNFIPGFGDVAVDLVRAVGLPPDRTSSFRLIVNPDELIRIEAEILVEDHQVRRLKEVLVAHKVQFMARTDTNVPEIEAPHVG